MDIQSVAAVVLVFGTIALLWLRIKRKGACGTGCGCSHPAEKKVESK